MTVKVIYANKKLNADHLLGTFLDKEHYDTLIDFDCDVYSPSLDGSMTEDNIVAKFRKGVFTIEEQQMAYDGLRDAATQSQNRGIAAGPRGDRLEAQGRGGRDWVTAYHFDVIEWLTRPLNLLEDDTTLDEIKKRHKKPIEDTRGFVWLRSKVIAEFGEYDGWFEKWLDKILPLTREEQIKEAIRVRDNYISETNYAQSVMSGVAGYYGRYPRIPFGRATSYTEKNPEKFEMAFPFLRKLNNYFKELLPERWAIQKAAIDKLDKRFVIDDTVFTTLTVNHNWRTAAHLDAGDLGPGFSNLTGVTNHREGKTWKGAELVCPEYRVAFNVRPGDLLLVANHTAIHGNAPLDPDFDNDRITIVAYFREDMLELKSWEYEALRKQFVYERSKNKDHPDWKPLFNGVSAGMWESKEWADYLKAHNMVDEDGIVKTTKEKQTSLSEFF